MREEFKKKKYERKTRVGWIINVTIELFIKIK